MWLTNCFNTINWMTYPFFFSLKWCSIYMYLPRFLVCFFDLPVPAPIPHCFGNLSFIMHFNVREVNPSNDLFWIFLWKYFPHEWIWITFVMFPKEIPFTIYWNCVTVIGECGGILKSLQSWIFLFRDIESLRLLNPPIFLNKFLSFSS